MAVPHPKIYKMPVYSAPLTRSNGKGELQVALMNLFTTDSRVFSLTIHILTLLAFTTHAVLGCCGHHGHAPLSRAAASACTTQVAAETSGQLQRTFQNCAQCTCCGDKAHGSVALEAHCPSDDSCPGDDTCPGDDSNHCQGTTCAYVASNVKCVPVATVSLNFGVAIAPIELHHAFAPGEARSWTAQASGTRYRTSCALCALLQTWQV